MCGENFSIDIPLWATNAALNLPLFILGARARGPAFIKKSLFAVIVFTPALYLASLIPKYTDIFAGLDLPLSSVFGGVLMGAGLGLVFRRQATTGGSDLAASILQKYRPHLSISKTMLVIDSVIIGAGFFTFGPERAMYAVIAVFVCSRITAAAIEGLSFAKAAFIISDKPDEIAAMLMTDLARGVTALSGTGMYTGASKKSYFAPFRSRKS